MTQSTNPSQQWNNIKKKKMNVVEQFGQSSDLNPVKDLWNDLKMAEFRRSHHYLRDLGHFCKEEWNKMNDEDRSSVDVGSYQKAEIQAKCDVRVLDKGRVQLL